MKKDEIKSGLSMIFALMTPMIISALALGIISAYMSMVGVSLPLVLSFALGGALLTIYFFTNDYFVNKAFNLEEDNKVVDVRFDGEACAICTSTTSIMVGLLIGKSKEEALSIIDNYKNMIDDKAFDVEKLKEAIVYSDISKQPNRKNCALLTWNGMEELLKKD